MNKCVYFKISIQLGTSLNCVVKKDVFACSNALTSFYCNGFKKQKRTCTGCKRNYGCDRATVFLLIRAPSLIVAPPPEKPLNHDNLVNNS